MDCWRFNGTVERIPHIDAWLKGHAGELGAIARQWFEYVGALKFGKFCMTAARLHVWQMRRLPT